MIGINIFLYKKTIAVRQGFFDPNQTMDVGLSAYRAVSEVRKIGILGLPGLSVKL